MSTSGSPRRGLGSVLVLTMVLLLVLLALSLGHDRFSSQMLWTSQKGFEGALALTLAENAVEEARFELGRRVNVPSDPLYSFFRQGHGHRLLDPQALSLSHSAAMLHDETYKRYNYESEPAEVEIVSQDPFGNFSFETRGVLRYFSSVTGYPIRNPRDKLVRQVEVRQEFKVALIGPPSPFDRMTLFVANGGEFLGLDSSDEWVNTNLLINKMRAEVEKIRANRDAQKARLLSYSQYRDQIPLYDQVLADLDAMPFDALTKIAQYEQAYGRPYLFPDPPLALVALNSSGVGLKLDELGSDAWVRLEPDWQARKAVADAAEARLNYLEQSQHWIGNEIRRHIAELRYLSEFDQDMLMKRIYPLYFANCRLDHTPRPVYNVIASDASSDGGSALDHYSSLLATFARDQLSWRQKFFFKVERKGEPSINAALDRFRAQQDPSHGVLNGVVYVYNPGEALKLTEPIPGKLVLIVEGDVLLSNLGRADNSSILTVVSYGNMAVEGDVNAGLIPRGSFRTIGNAVAIHGNLILDESYHWQGRVPRLAGQLFPDYALTSSSESAPGNVAIFPDHQMVVLSPTTESRVVNRTGS